MEVVEMNVRDLKEYANNPRHNNEAVEMVANSIGEFGFRVPILIDENNVIVAGHTRLKAAKKLGMDKVPTIRINDLTPEQIRAFRLADNRVGEIATWDMDKLDTEMQDLRTEFLMEDFGFDMTMFNFDAGSDSGGKESGSDIKPTVIIECATNSEAEETYAALTKAGYQCRLKSK